jgi:hypothetical protein
MGWAAAVAGSLDHDALGRSGSAAEAVAAEAEAAPQPAGSAVAMSWSASRKRWGLAGAAVLGQNARAVAP